MPNQPRPRRKLAAKPIIVAETSNAEQIKTGDIIVATIKRIGINGEGVGYYRKKAVFIPGALPDEVVKAKVVKVEKTFIRASLVVIEKRSPYRIKPANPNCEIGGCSQLQHMHYEGQLKAKEELVKEAFFRYTGLDKLPLRPIIGMENPWHYRTKAQLQAGFINGKTVLGLYRPGTHEIVEMEECPIQHPAINRIAVAVRRILQELNMPVYDERTKRGDLRTVVIRTTLAGKGESQLTFITKKEKLPAAEKLIARVRSALPEVVTIAHNVNATDTPLVFGEKTTILWGKETIEERLRNLRFSLSPRAFFQLNPKQAEMLYDKVKEAAALTGRETVVDAYCGTGAIALWLASEAREVRGIEAIDEAVEDARRNADTNGMKNAHFYAGKAEELLPQWSKQGFRPDVIVADPPRSGCAPELLQAIAQIRPKRFVYVSCNPSTLAKDCAVLLAKGFKLQWVQPVDMFPHTAHVESVVLMVRMK
ncbi:MAG TPA: 23S rRNA (uracil(1939)-C(5))-methyltransferase RlmD [Bacilli bacterium]